MNELNLSPNERVMTRLKGLPYSTLLSEAGTVWGNIETGKSPCCGGELQIIADGRKCKTCATKWTPADVRALRVSLKSCTAPTAEQGRRGAHILG
jgi:hypothetical protein